MSRFGPGWKGRRLTPEEIVALYGQAMTRPIPPSFKPRVQRREGRHQAWHNYPLEYAKRMLIRTNGAQEWRERVEELTSGKAQPSGVRFAAVPESDTGSDTRPSPPLLGLTRRG